MGSVAQQSINTWMVRPSSTLTATRGRGRGRGIEIRCDVAPKARFVARRRETLAVQQRQQQRPLHEYMKLPASQYSVLDAERIERVDDNTFRCFVYRFKFFSFEVCPVLLVRVTQSLHPLGTSINLLSCTLEGSPIVVAQNHKFQGIISFLPPPPPLSPFDVLLRFWILGMQLLWLIKSPVVLTPTPAPPLDCNTSLLMPLLRSLSTYPSHLQLFLSKLLNLMEPEYLTKYLESCFLALCNSWLRTTRHGLPGIPLDSPLVAVKFELSSNFRINYLRLLSCLDL